MSLAAVRARLRAVRPRPVWTKEPVRDAIRALDERMRRRRGIIEFTDDPHCILRISLATADQDVRLADGVLVRAGDPIIEMHFWNERMPQAKGAGGLGWGGRFSRRLRRSFDDLAYALERDPRLAGAVAMRGRLAFAGARNSDDARRFGAWFGFDMAAGARPNTLRRRLRDLIEDVWLLALTYAFNPGGLRGRALVRRRDDMWISRARLTERYGARPPEALRSAA